MPRPCYLPCFNPPKLWTSSLCSFLHSSVTSSPLDQVLSSVVSIQTLSVRAYCEGLSFEGLLNIAVSPPLNPKFQDHFLSALQPFVLYICSCSMSCTGNDMEETGDDLSKECWRYGVCMRRNFSQHDSSLMRVSHPDTPEYKPGIVTTTPGASVEVSIFSRLDTSFSTHIRASAWVLNPVVSNNEPPLNATVCSQNSAPCRVAIRIFCCLRVFSS
jgi:hypothetical protein